MELRPWYGVPVAYYRTILYRHPRCAGRKLLRNSRPSVRLHKARLQHCGQHVVRRLERNSLYKSLYNFIFSLLLFIFQHKQTNNFAFDYFSTHSDSAGDNEIFFSLKYFHTIDYTINLCCRASYLAINHHQPPHRCAILATSTFVRYARLVQFSNKR